MKAISPLAALAACAVAAGCAATALEDFDNRYTVAGPDKVIAFVGRKVEVARIVSPADDAAADDGSILISLDLGFAARYEILELVHGAYDRPFIDFEAYDHYGFPRFADPAIAMLYLVEYEGGLFHWKYQWDPVHKTKDGRYAFCGDRYAQLDDEEKSDIASRPLQPLAFDRPVVVKISDRMIPKERRRDYDKEAIERNRAEISGFYSEPAFKVRGDLATCEMGVYADELFRIKNETLFLPERRLEMCEADLRITGDHPFDSKEAKAIRACVARLKAEGAP